jgi:hypothetical protein
MWIEKNRSPADDHANNSAKWFYSEPDFTFPGVALGL